MLRVVVDTNLWIRVLLRGPKSFPLLEAWRDHRFAPRWKSRNVFPRSNIRCVAGC
jgi:predicted nucleic acid-binding protein